MRRKMVINRSLYLRLYSRRLSCLLAMVSVSLFEIWTPVPSTSSPAATIDTPPTLKG